MSWRRPEIRRSRSAFRSDADCPSAAGTASANSAVKSADDEAGAASVNHRNDFGENAGLPALPTGGLRTRTASVVARLPVAVRSDPIRCSMFGTSFDALSPAPADAPAPAVDRPETAPEPAEETAPGRAPARAGLPRREAETAPGPRRPRLGRRLPSVLVGVLSACARRTRSRISSSSTATSASLTSMRERTSFTLGRRGVGGSVVAGVGCASELLVAPTALGLELGQLPPETKQLDLTPRARTDHTALARRASRKPPRCDAGRPPSGPEGRPRRARGREWPTATARPRAARSLPRRGRGRPGAPGPAPASTSAGTARACPRA